MTAEQFLWTWLRSEVIEPKRLYCKPTNLYYEALKDNIAAHEKEQVNPAKQRKPKYTGQYTKKAVHRRRKENPGFLCVGVDRSEPQYDVIAGHYPHSNG